MSLAPYMFASPARHPLPRATIAPPNSRGPGLSFLLLNRRDDCQLAIAANDQNAKLEALDHVPMVPASPRRGARCGIQWEFQRTRIWGRW